MRELQIGCVGCGFVADIHLRNAKRIPGLHVRAVADLREQAALDFHNRHGSEYWTTEAPKLFADPGIDAVLICTYGSSHAELATAAARNGKHVFLEKPMAHSSADCLAIMRACKENDVKLALDLKFRFTTAALQVKRAIHQPVVVVAQTSMNEISETDHGKESCDRGIVPDLGAHLLDLACYFAGSEPTRIFALGSQLPHRQTDFLDVVMGTLEFQSGCLATFVISDCAEWPVTSKWFIEVADGQRKAVIYNHFRTAHLGGDSERVIDESNIPPHEIGAYEALRDFSNAVREDRSPRVGGTDGLRFAVLSESLRQSIHSGKAVPVRSPEGAEPWFEYAYANQV